MKLLLTGSTGFVGRNVLLQALREARYREIWVPVRSREKLRAQFVGDGFDGIPSVVKPIEASAPDWDLSLAGEVDHVIHSAGVIFARTRQEYMDTNVEGTMQLLRTLIRPERSKIVLLSSQSAAGPCPTDEAALTESSREAPLTWYGQSKLEMERRIAAEFPELDYLALRPPMIFGPRDHATLPLFKMVRRTLHFKPGFKPKRYSFVSVTDLSQAIFAALDNAAAWKSLSKRHFFVASDSTVTDKDLIRFASEACGRRAGVMVSIPQPLLWGLSRVIDSIPTWRATIPNLSVDRAKEIWPNKWVCSPAAFQEAFSWKATEDLPSALKATRDWYVKTGQLA